MTTTTRHDNTFCIDCKRAVASIESNIGCGNVCTDCYIRSWVDCASCGDCVPMGNTVYTSIRQDGEVWCNPCHDPFAFSTCPVCEVGELQWRAVQGLVGEYWVCTDVGRGWGPNRYQYGYCGVALTHGDLFCIPGKPYNLQEAAMYLAELQRIEAREMRRKLGPCECAISENHNGPCYGIDCDCHG
jgi:hypothetical protein